MSEISRAINQFFKEATKPEISEVTNKVNFKIAIFVFSAFLLFVCFLLFHIRSTIVL